MHTMCMCDMCMKYVHEYTYMSGARRLVLAIPTRSPESCLILQAKMHAADAAMHNDTRSFMPCFVAEHCFDGAQTTADAWVALFAQVVLGIFLLAGPPMQRRLASGGKSQSAPELNEESVGLLTWLLRTNLPKRIRSVTKRLGLSNKSAKRARRWGVPAVPAVRAGASPSSRLAWRLASKRRTVETQSLASTTSLPSPSASERSDDGSGRRSPWRRAAANSFEEQTVGGRRVSKWSAPRASKCVISAVGYMARASSHYDFVRGLRRPKFLSHERTESNFFRPLTDPRCHRPPKAATSCRKRMFMRYGLSRGKMYAYLLFRAGPQLIDSSLGVALLSGSLSSLVALLHAYGTYCKKHDGSTRWLDNVQYLSDSMETIMDAFRFFPVFLLFGFLTYVTSLWLRFVETGTLVQGRLHGIAMLAGGAVIDPSCVATRARIWQLYRYLNVAHLLCYYSISPQLHEAIELHPGLIKLGLLTPAELEMLLPHENKMRDAMCSWISALLHEGVRKGQFGPPVAGPPLFDTCNGLRGTMAGLHEYDDADLEPSTSRRSIGYHSHVRAHIGTVSSILTNRTCGRVSCSSSSTSTSSSSPPACLCNSSCHVSSPACHGQPSLASLQW